MAAFLAKLLIFLGTVPSVWGISCLVVRPGYGLVSEQCPPSAVGCRIRVMSDHIDWYEWAKLYDRNQLVCVYPGEYRTDSGCQKKASGSVRCWCGGGDDCNSAENSKDLYEKHFGPLEKKELRSNRVHTTTAAPPTTTERTTTTRRPTTTTKRTPPTLKIHIQPTVRRFPTATTTTTSTQTTVATTSAPKETTFPEVKAHPLPTDGRDKYDEIFDATRKALEEQMKEEDERLQQMLMDEEDEQRGDEEDEDVQPSQEERAKLERRERARMEEKRRQEEEERLARIEREEAEEMERRELEQGRREEEEDYEYEGGGGFGLTATSTIAGTPLLVVTIISIFLR